MSLPRRSQSALEYMMTYGWAILVIVIVAAVLYSLGIFSPSSSLSTTITGFSNLGTVNAVCLGGTSFTISMGDSTGYPINITQINLTSSLGKTTYSPNILIQPNSIQTVTVPSSSLCSPGARYSVSAVISYLEPGQVFQGPYTSTGTVAGTANSPPSSATSYETLNITNTQNEGTPSPFQQMINVTSSSPGWVKISSSPFGQNVEFFSSTGQILDSWLENYTSAHAIWWVKLTSSISAGSKQTIYMGFAPTSTNLFNTNDIGEAPQLSSTFAGYDDGKDVFSYYNNSNGEGFTIPGSSTSSGNGLAFFLPQSYTSGMVIVNAFIPNTTQYPAYFSGNDFADLQLRNSNSGYFYYRTGNATYYDIYSNSNSQGFNTGGRILNLNQFNIPLTYEMIISENVSKAALNMNNVGWIYFPTSLTGLAFDPINEIAFGTGSDGTGSDTVFIHYIAIVQYGQAMPSVSFGSVS